MCLMKVFSLTISAPSTDVLDTIRLRGRSSKTDFDQSLEKRANRR